MNKIILITLIQVIVFVGAVVLLPPVFAADAPYAFDWTLGENNSGHIISHYGFPSTNPFSGGSGTFLYREILIKCKNANPYTGTEGDCTYAGGESIIKDDKGSFFTNDSGVGEHNWDYTVSGAGCYQYDLYSSHDDSALSGSAMLAGIFCYAPPITIGGRVTTSDGNSFPTVQINAGQPNNCFIGVSNPTNVNGNYWYSSVTYNLNFCLRPPIVSGYSRPPEPWYEDKYATATKTDYNFTYGCPTAPASVSISSPTGNSPYLDSTTAITFIWTASSITPQRYNIRIVDNTDSVTYSYDSVTSPYYVSNGAITFFKPGHSYSWWIDAHSDYCNAKTTSSNFSIADTVTQFPPAVTTDPASSVAQTSATLNGNVTSDGGASVSARGFFLKLTSENNNCTLTNTTGCAQITSGTGTGTFFSNQTSLISGTPYSYKAYARNIVDTSYGFWKDFSTTTTAPSVSLSATSPIASGNSTTLTWTVTGSADSCSVNNSGTPAITSGDWITTLTGSDVSAGTHTRAITMTTTTSGAVKTFNITCIKSGVNSSLASAQVTVNATPDVTLSVNPASITSGGSTTLTWTVTGAAASCTVANTGNPAITSGSWSGTLTGADVTSGSHTRSITMTSSTSDSKTFTIYCTNPAGNSSTRTAVVGVSPAGTPAAPTISNTPSCVSGGSYTATLAWSGTGYNTLSCGTGFWVDIDNDPDWNNGFYHACISDPTRSTAAPTGFGAYCPPGGTCPAGPPPLTLQPDITYRARTYNGAQSAVAGFGPISACTVPVVDIKAALQGGVASDGPVTIANNSVATISWTTANCTTANNCSCTPTGGTGNWTTSNKAIAGGNENTAALAGPNTYTYTLTCTNTAGPSLPDSVTVNVSGSGGGTCTGTPLLTFNPNPATPRDQVTAAISGITGCTGITTPPTVIPPGGVTVPCPMNATGTGCQTPTFPAPSPPGGIVRGCIDMNSDGDCTDGGETPVNTLFVNNFCAWIQTIGGAVHSNFGINTRCVAP